MRGLIRVLPVVGLSCDTALMADDLMTGMVPPLFADVPKSVTFKKLRKRIVRNALQAIDQFGMVDRTRGQAEMAGLLVFAGACLICAVANAIVTRSAWRS